jgi:hypothetical protein
MHQKLFGVPTSHDIEKVKQKRKRRSKIIKSNVFIIRFYMKQRVRCKRKLGKHNNSVKNFLVFQRFATVRGA